MWEQEYNNRTGQVNGDAPSDYYFCDMGSSKWEV